MGGLVSSLSYLPCCCHRIAEHQDPAVSSNQKSLPSSDQKSLPICLELEGTLLHALVALDPMDWARLCIASRLTRAKMLHRWQSKPLMVNKGSLALVERQDLQGLALAVVHSKAKGGDLCDVTYFDDYNICAVPVTCVHVPPRNGLFASLAIHWVELQPWLEQRRQILCACCIGGSPRNDWCLAVAATLEQAQRYAGRKADLFDLLECSVRRRDWELVGLWTHLGGDIYGKTAAGGSLLVIAMYNGDTKQLQRVVKQGYNSVEEEENKS